MTIESGLPGLYAIHESFAGTEMGETLRARVRYEKYKPLQVSNRRWVMLLGADANNLTHLPLTYGLTRVMIRYLRELQPGELTDHEETVLQAAALIHDWAEAVVGDISYGDKTAEDEVEEMRQLTRMLGRHYGDSSSIRGTLDEAAEVVRQPLSGLGVVFNTVERVGYVRTALRAAGHVLNGTAPDCADGFRWIVADVFGNQVAVLIDRSERYLPVCEYLTRQSAAITGAFGTVTVATFLNYPEPQRELKSLAFRVGGEAWLSWA